MSGEICIFSPVDNHRFPAYTVSRGGEAADFDDMQEMRMDYYLLTDLAVTMAYHLARSGAETFRVEDTVHRRRRA